MTHDEREVIRVFLDRFRTDWYDLGFSDPVEWSAVHRPIGDDEDDPDAELCRRLSYLTGAADMARLGSPYMSTQYLIANTIGNLCRSLIVSEHIMPSIQRTLNVYERELAALVVALAATVRAA
jgi:hypothetical protein